ncbi:MAG: hypothetical protein IK104_03300 [Clostridia bacterium]|nr:hypothetical protein [Clostridia bacterium]
MSERRLFKEKSPQAIHSLRRRGASVHNGFDQNAKSIGSLYIFSILFRTFDRSPVLLYDEITKGTEVFIMMKEKKVKMKFTDFECNLLINGINEWRNMLLAVDYPTEDVDMLLLKLIKKAEGK